MHLKKLCRQKPVPGRTILPIEDVCNARKGTRRGTSTFSRVKIGKMAARTGSIFKTQFHTTNTRYQTWCHHHDKTRLLPPFLSWNAANKTEHNHDFVLVALHLWNSSGLVLHRRTAVHVNHVLCSHLSPSCCFIPSPYHFLSRSNVWLSKYLLKLPSGL